MRVVFAFTGAFFGAFAAYLVARAVGIFLWGISPESIFGEALLSFGAGVAMAVAIEEISSLIMKNEDSSRVALACFSVIATLMLLTVALGLLSNSTYMGSRVSFVISMLALPCGFFGYRHMK